MAVIDSLLKLMSAEGANALSITANDVPVLYKAGSPFKLSMPAVSPELAKSFAKEVVGADGSEALAKGEDIKGTYRSSDGKEFSYRVIPQARGICLKLSLLGTDAVSGDDVEFEQDDGVQSEETEESRPRVKALPRKQGVDLDALAPGQPARAPDSDTVAATATEASSEQPLLSAIEQALELGASDLFFSANEPPRVRVGGAIEILPCPATPQEHILALAGIENSEDRTKALREKGSIDFAVQLNIAGAPCRFRASLFQHRRGLAVALRPIRNRAPTLKELNLPEDLRKLCAYPSGLVLVTGPAGSGKSTTLTALVDYINRTKARHIITLEDPIEFEHSHGQSIIHQREIGCHVESFSEGLRAALRESPDIILVGEMRDLPTIAAALTAAETGHLVLSTLHTGDATSAVDRIIDVFPGHQQTQVRVQLASVLRAVVTQCLVPTTRGPKRYPAFEKLVATDAVSCQIREGRTHQIPSLIQAGGADGMITLERSLASLVSSGKITLTAATNYARDVDALNKLVNSA
jgi:twitching motility protein PilT